MIHIYHLKGINLSGQTYVGKDGANFPEAFVKAATIQLLHHEKPTDALNRAYRMTQNDDYPWTNKKSIISTGLSGRSTSVGDVIMVDDKVYRCMPVGWEEVKTSEAKR